MEPEPLEEPVVPSLRSHIFQYHLINNNCIKLLPVEKPLLLNEADMNSRNPYSSRSLLAMGLREICLRSGQRLLRETSWREPQRNF